VPRTVSIVIVFVMLGLIVTPSTYPNLLPRGVIVAPPTGGGTAQVVLVLLHIIIARSILAVRTVPLLTFTQEQPPR
jgi:hypothetical protein